MTFPYFAQIVFHLCFLIPTTHGQLNRLNRLSLNDCVDEFRLFRNKDISGPVTYVSSQSVQDFGLCMEACVRMGQLCKSLVREEYNRRQPTCHLFGSTLATPGITLLHKVPGTFPKYDYYERSPRCAELKRKEITSRETRNKLLPTVLKKEWSEWSDCSESCGGGLQIRERICESCLNDKLQKELKACNVKRCPGESLIIEELNGRWSSWSDWSFCTGPCEGSQKRYRMCFRGQNYCNGLETSESQSRRCRCARHNFSGTGIWTSWSRWAVCSVTCGNGEKVRTRQCTVPDDCEGTFEKVEECMEAPCLEPQWQRWENWSPCSESCGSGVRVRTRTCTELGKCTGSNTSETDCRLQECAGGVLPVSVWNPWQSWSTCTKSCGAGGERVRRRTCPDQTCVGKDSAMEECYEGSCPGEPPGWDAWTEWTTCSATCGTGTRSRSRNCPDEGVCPGEAALSEDCIEIDCPILGWEAWLPWSVCSKTCGTGQQTRTRVCPPDGRCPGSATGQKNCNLATCPGSPGEIGAKNWNPWTQWNQCSRTCGPAVRFRIRTCPQGGVCPGTDNQEDACNQPPCPQIVWTQWTPWEQCSVTCGQGTRSRQRTCPAGGACPGLGTVTESCTETACPGATQGWTPWEDWSGCSVTCGPGTQTRRRSCPSGQCPGNPFEMSNCLETNCPIGWTPWTQWSFCSATCGRGTRSRTRDCPLGEDCPGLNVENEACFETVCPVNWQNWLPWTECSATCGRGSQTRNRNCPTAGACAGDGTESESCTKTACPNAQPGWTAWLPWSACSVTCGPGIQTRSRSCPSGQCPGEPVEQTTCFERNCVVNWTPWEQWNFCSVTCGQGSRTRNRACPPGGTCVGDATEAETCSQPICPGAIPGWTPWLPWSACSVTCGQGTQRRTRSCPSGQCPGEPFMEINCIQPDCPVNWTPWVPWSDCSVTCGQGSRNRNRVCPRPGECAGDGTESESCTKPRCPGALPGWTTWLPWGACSVTCGPGIQTRSRNCPSGQCPGESFEQNNCFERPCLLNWMQWIPWSTCSASCGRGTRTRTRQCPPGGNCPGDNTDNEACLETACPAQWQNWFPWTACTITCGQGSRTRSRICPPGGSCAGDSTQAEACTESPCPNPIPDWTPWNPWSTCSVTCGPGKQTRSRNCPSGSCPGESFEQAACQQRECLKTGECQQWLMWSPCTVSCGPGGKQNRIRICGIDYTPETEDRTCTPGACPGPGVPVWQEWSPWSGCSMTCGGGFRSRSRICSQPNGCTGSPNDSQPCNPETCPTVSNPQWLQWAPWTDCSKSCNLGQRSRERVCSTPGRCVIGVPTDIEVCIVAPCPGDPPVWLNWGPWSQCTTTCGDLGVQFRNRECSSPAQCPGTDTERQICDPGPCTTWSPWSNWNTCSATCGPGIRVRTRSCPVPQACVGSDTSEQNCEITLCAGPNWLRWQDWRPCSTTCGPGEQVRVRVCSQPNRCPGQGADSKACEVTPCGLPHLDWSLWSPWSGCSATCSRFDGAAQNNQMGLAMRARARACPKQDRCQGDPLHMEFCNQFPCPGAAVPDVSPPLQQPTRVPSEIQYEPPPVSASVASVTTVKQQKIYSRIPNSTSNLPGQQHVLLLLTGPPPQSNPWRPLQPNPSNLPSDSQEPLTGDQTFDPVALSPQPPPFQPLYQLSSETDGRQPDERYVSSRTKQPSRPVPFMFRPMVTKRDRANNREFVIHHNTPFIDIGVEQPDPKTVWVKAINDDADADTHNEGYDSTASYAFARFRPFNVLNDVD